MRTLPSIAALTLLLACQGKGAGAGRHDDDDERSAAQDPSPYAAAPGLTGKTIDGQPYDLAAARGEVVLLNVWATWCAPCREELPALRRLHERYAGQGFGVVGVSVDRRNALMGVRRMVEEFGLPYPIVFDPESEAITPWNVRGYPTSFLVDRSGRVRWRRDGTVTADDPELLAAIDAALAGTP